MEGTRAEGCVESNSSCSWVFVLGSPGAGQNPPGRRLCTAVLLWFACTSWTWMSLGRRVCTWAEKCLLLCCFCAGGVVLHHIEGHRSCCQFCHTGAGSPALLHNRRDTSAPFAEGHVDFFYSLSCKEICAGNIPLTCAAAFKKGHVEA